MKKKAWKEREVIFVGVTVFLIYIFVMFTFLCYVGVFVLFSLPQ